MGIQLALGVDPWIDFYKVSFVHVYLPWTRVTMKPSVYLFKNRKTKNNA